MQRVIAIVLVAASATSSAAQPAPVEAVLAKTDALAKEVAKLRGLKLKRPIPNDVVDREQLRQRLLSLANEDKTKADIAGEGAMYKRWGLLPPGTDYGAMLVDLLADQIAGYYDTETKKLTIAKDGVVDLAWTELVLAHELAHGLQDQTFDLKKFEELPSTEGDASAARRALVEGDALAVMIELMLGRSNKPAPWSNPDVVVALQKGMSVPGAGDTLDRAPLVVRESLIFPYRAGLGFVAALRRRQPWSAVDAAFGKPPRSTEQVIHFERYLLNDQPVQIELTTPASLVPFAIIHSTVWGELGFDSFLRAHGVAADSAAIAAEGWGGDRIVTLALPDRPKRTIGLGRIDMDTEPDAIEAVEAATKALDDALPGATIERGLLRTRWLALDGTVGWIDRKGTSFIIAIGVPAWLAEAALADLWTAAVIVTPKRS